MTKKENTKQVTPKEEGEQTEQNETAPEMSPKKIRQHQRAKKMMIKKNAKMTAIILAVVLVLAVLCSLVLISCANDILAVGVPKDDKKITITIDKNMHTKDVVEALADAGAIKNPLFCRVCASVLGYTNDGYVPGEYEIKRSMGLEKMLNRVKLLDVDRSQTVRITFPEGLTVDEIIDSLEENGVCSGDKLRQTIRETDFSEDYDFLKSRSDLDRRYSRLEGYMYPDTYDFYIGENTESVVRKFLNNFEKHWTKEFDDAIKARGLTIDKAITLSSIVEKEAREDEMGTVAGIMFNRIDANMRLDCDSTTLYASTAGEKFPDKAEQFMSDFDTYNMVGCPIGPICNTGERTIRAVLNAPETDYYYFIHDAEGVFRTAESLEEQEYNINTYGVLDN